jgi:pimeloyl-ACP methyl ester carboxylesterase
MTLFRLFILIGLIGGLISVSACSGGGEPPPDVAQSPYFSPDDHIIDLDGQRVRYRDTGPDDALTIIMLHGFTDSLHTWDAVAEVLDDRFRILRPDLPGHGLSGPAPDDDYSNAALIRFVGKFTEAVDAQTPVLMGNSLGGLAAWRFAAENPERVSGLVLLAPGGVPYNGIGDTPLPVPAMLKFYLNQAPEAGVRTALSAMHADPARVSNADITQYRDLMRQSGNADAFIARAAQFTLPNPADDMTKVTVPTHIIWGVQDVMLPVDQADQFAAHMRNVTILRLDGVGHLPQSEAPERVVETLQTLVAEIESLP